MICEFIKNNHNKFRRFNFIWYKIFKVFIHNLKKDIIKNFFNTIWISLIELVLKKTSVRIY